MSKVSLWKDQSMIEFWTSAMIQRIKSGTKMSESMNQSVRKNCYIRDVIDKWVMTWMHDWTWGNNQMNQRITESMKEWVSQWTREFMKKYWMNECVELNYILLNWNRFEQKMAEIELHWKRDEWKGHMERIVQANDMSGKTWHERHEWQTRK